MYVLHSSAINKVRRPITKYCHLCTKTATVSYHKRCHQALHYLIPKTSELLEMESNQERK